MSIPEIVGYVVSLVIILAILIALIVIAKDEWDKQHSTATFRTADEARVFSDRCNEKLRPEAAAYNRMLARAVKEGLYNVDRAIKNAGKEGKRSCNYCPFFFFPRGLEHYQHVYGEENGKKLLDDAENAVLQEMKRRKFRVNNQIISW